MKSSKHIILATVGLVGIGVLSRLAPHLPNATPLNALTNVARTYVGTTASFAVPLLTLVLSDFIIGFYDWRILVSVYACFALSAFFAHIAPISARYSILTYPLLTSLTFFIVTNGAVWAFSPWYEASLAGLLACYAAGVPFLRYMLIGDMVYMCGAHLATYRRAQWLFGSTRPVSVHPQ